jgi:hypothetical protein
MRVLVMMMPMMVVMVLGVIVITGLCECGTSEEGDSEYE